MYKEDQPLFHEMENVIPNIHFHQGLMSRKDVVDKFCTPPNKHVIVVMDDLMREVVDSHDVMDFFTVSCHHNGCSVIIVMHNLYHQGRHSKTLAVNAGYVILFESPASMSQIHYYGCQRFPQDKILLPEAYSLAVQSKRFGYIVVDMTAGTYKDFRLRSRVMPDEEMIFFIRTNAPSI